MEVPDVQHSGYGFKNLSVAKVQWMAALRGMQEGCTADMDLCTLLLSSLGTCICCPLRQIPASLRKQPEGSRCWRSAGSWALPGTAAP